MLQACDEGYEKNKKAKGRLHNSQNYPYLNPDSWFEILIHPGLDDTHMVARGIYPVN